MAMIIASCSVSKTKLTAGKNVKVMPTKKSNCEVVTKVIGINDNGSLDLAKNHARNLAGDQGANAITFDEEFRNGKEWKVHSTAYLCE